MKQQGVDIGKKCVEKILAQPWLLVLVENPSPIQIFDRQAEDADPHDRAR